MSWQDVAGSADVREGAFFLVNLGKRGVGLTRVQDRLFAVLNYCPHAGAPICAGRVEGMVTAPEPGVAGFDHARTILRCPWHHWEYDLADGRGVCAGSGRIKLYPVREEQGRISVDI